MMIQKEINGFQFKYDTDEEILYKKCRVTGKWLNCKNLIPNQMGYLRIGCRKDNKRYDYLYHRVVFKMFNESFDFNNRKLKIDHRDRNPLNNSISNLKIVTTQENLQNTDAYGVHFHKKMKTKPWGAKWVENGKQKSKYFSTEAEAKKYRDMKVKEFYYLGDRN